MNDRQNSMSTAAACPHDLAPQRHTHPHRRIFHQYDELVYAAPSGVVVRAIAPVLQHKLHDPAVRRLICWDAG